MLRPHASAGTGRDIVPRYPSPYYPWVPVTIAFWDCSQLENICFTENTKKHQPVHLSLAHACMGRVRKCRNVRLIVYKRDFSRCGDFYYKPITLNFPLFAWNSFLFRHSIISIRVTGSNFVPG